MTEFGSESIRTSRLRLKLQSVDDVQEMLKGFPPEVRCEISADWISLVQNATEPSPWIHGFTVHEGDDENSIGNFGFKGLPNDQGEVEIAYAINESHQNRGYATEAAAALTKFALAQDGVQTVIAHTLPNESASTRVLEKCGYQCLGEAEDPDDGKVWRWTIG
ncbi:MAG: GNAT family N-acetyltransferase [Aureliella sp.]